MSLISYNDIKKKSFQTKYMYATRAVQQQLYKIWCKKNMVNVPGTSHIQKFVKMLRSKPIPVF